LAKAPPQNKTEFPGETTNEWIIQDMLQDQHTYAWCRSVYYPSTFTHAVSHEYSPHWVGPMLYDSLTIYSEVQERYGRLHRARVRLTVGYTAIGGNYVIYALVLKVT
jgi:hypothetical protein